MDLTALKQLGLNNSEIKVYFALLELETSTVGPIIDKADVPDSKIYIILDKLKDKGLVSHVIKNKVKHFQAADPKVLTKIIEQKQKELSLQKTVLEKKIIPEIEKRRKLTEDKQEATIYESKAGLKAAFLYMLDSLNRGEEYQVLSFEKGLGTKEAVDFFREHHKRRQNRGIKVRLIAQKSKCETILKKHIFVRKNTRYTTQNFPIGLYLFKNHVMTVLWGEKKTAFIIKSKENYESYKIYFEDLWKKSKK